MQFKVPVPRPSFRLGVVVTVILVVLRETIYTIGFDWIVSHLDELGDGTDAFFANRLSYLVILPAILALWWYLWREYGDKDEARRPKSKSPMPVWLEKVVEHDRKELRSCLQQVDPDSQYGNVFFNLDDKHAPSVWFRFMYVNTSIYTVHLTKVEGILQADHEAVKGAFDLKPVQVSHGGRFILKLPYVISTDASVATIRSLLAEGKEICFDLNNVRVTLEIKEDDAEARPAELRFSAQQFWHPPTPPPAPPPAATLEDDDAGQETASEATGPLGDGLR